MHTLSLDKQESPGNLPIQSVTIVGGRGDMGRLFIERLERLGLEPSVLDKPLDLRRAEAALPASDLILLTVPMQAVAEVLAAIHPFLGDTAIVADICSVKVKPMQALLEGHPGPVVGTHPLFGPYPDKATELRVALIQGRDRRAFHQVESLFSSLGLCPFETTAEEHDRAMAFIQGLNFVTTVSYLASVSRIESIETFLTPSFSRRLAAARKMLTEDADMFLDLFESNPFSHDAVRQFRSMLNLAAAGELDLLREKAGWWWRQDHTEGGVPRQP